MTAYDELTTAFDEWRKDYFDDARRSSGFARWFAKEFREYIGAPDTFEGGDHNDRKQEKYVKLLQVTPNDDGETYRTKETRSFFELLTMNDNGYWQFALALALESGPALYPKQYFNTLISFALKNDEVYVYVFDGSHGVFTCQLGVAQSFEPVFDHMTSLLLEHLHKKQADRVEEPTPDEPPPEPEPMGFVSFPRSPTGEAGPAT